MSDVIVKPLEWKDLDAAHSAAAPLFGSIRVEYYGGQIWNVVWSVPGYCATFTDGDFRSLEDAKAAAQADYESRILSALANRAPAPTDNALRAENERLRAALKALVDLEENTSYFGGEFQQDRIERTWEKARAALATPSADGGAA